MFNFLSDFLREAFYNFRRRGIVRIFFFDGGAVSIGVAIFAISNMGGASAAFSSGFGIGVTSVGIVGLLSSYYESNFSFSRVLGYFCLEGGALQAGALIYSLSNYGAPETRIPSLAHIGIGIGGVGVCCVLYIFRQMAILYSDETIQLVRDLREFYKSESLAGSLMSRRRRSALRSIGLQLRVLSWSLNRRHLKDSPSTTEGDSSEVPQESDSDEDEREILMAIAKKTDNGHDRKSPSSSEESQTRCEVKAKESVCYPLSEERPETSRENVASHSESQRTRDSTVKIPDSEKDSNETHLEGVKSENAQGTTKSVYPPQGTSGYESKEEHGARRKTHLSKEVTKKTRAEKQPSSELFAVRDRIDRSPSNATSAADELKSLEQVFGVSPPRKVSPEPLRKRRVSPVEIKLQKKKADPPLEEKYGERSDLKKRPEQTSSDKSGEQTDLILVEKCKKKEFDFYKYKPTDDEDITCFDKVEMKQEINSAVEELVAILNSIMNRSPELNLEVTQEIDSDAKVDERNLDDNSDVSQNPEFADVSRKGAERVFEVPTEKYSSESGRLLPTSIAENQSPEPSAELINFIVRGCSQNLSDARTHSVPGSNTMETLEKISEILSGISVPPSEYGDASEDNKTLEEVEVSAHGVTRENLMVDSDITEMDQPQNQSVTGEILKKSSYSAIPNLTFGVEEQDIHTTRSSISERSQRTEACSITSDNSKIKEGFPLDGEFQLNARTGNQDGYQSLDTHVESSGDPQPTEEVLHCDKPQPGMESVSHRGEFEMVEPSTSRQGEPQFVKESISHHDEPQSAERGVLNYKELKVVVENIPHSSEIIIVPIAESIMHSKECQDDALHFCEPHMVLLHRGNPQPVKESVSQCDEPQPVEENVLYGGEPQRVEKSVLHESGKENALHSGDPQTVEATISHSSEPQPVEKGDLHSSQPQPVEESVSYSSEPQSVAESISYSGEPQSVEESVSHSGEPQPVDERDLNREVP